MEDICVGYDNTTVYTSPGDAVRTQISDLHDNLFDFFNTSCDYYEIITLNNSGFLSYGHPLDIYPSDSVTSYHTKVIPVISGDVYMYYGRGDSAAYSVFWFNKNMEPLNYEQYNTTMSDTYIAITVPINATYAIFQSFTNELKLYNTTRGINSVYKNIDDVNKKISEVRKDNIYFYNFTTSGNFNHLPDLCCFLDIPISKKGKLIIHCIQIYRNGEEIKPTKVYILKKVSTTQMYVIDVVNISNDMITDMCYIPNNSAKWITIDTGYYLSGDNNYYVGNNCIIYNTSITGDDNSSVENYAGYYSGVGNFEDICYKGNTFQLKDGGVPRTNSALMIYPEIISWEFIQDIPSKVSDLQNDLLFISTKWNNKIGDFLGDSITAQNQYTNKLNFLYGITVNNYGVSGSCISNILNAYYTPFYERVSSMNTDCDFVFMFGGTNDWGKNCPLGTKSDTEPNTFYGALYTTLTALRTRFPTKPIFVCTILQRNYNYRENMENNSNGNSIEEFNIAIKYMARKFGCIIIDLWQCGIYPDINGSTYMTDGVHINNVGGTRVAMFIKDSMERYTPY